MDKQRVVIGIIGTDTDAGKTVITGGLLRALHELGVAAAGIKPVQSGCAVLPSGVLQAPDVAVWELACPEAPSFALVKLPEACSPHLAARRAGLRLAAGTLAEGISRTAREAEVVLLEGAGGLLTPLNERETLAETCQQVCTAVLLVVANRLGAVNHGLLTLEALQARRIPVLGFVLNEPWATPEDDELTGAIQEDNAEIIARLGKAPCLGKVPYVNGLLDSGAADQVLGWRTVSAALGPAARIIKNNYCGVRNLSSAKAGRDRSPAGEPEGAELPRPPESLSTKDKKG